MEEGQTETLLDRGTGGRLKVEHLIDGTSEDRGKTQLGWVAVATKLLRLDNLRVVLFFAKGHSVRDHDEADHADTPDVTLERVVRPSGQDLRGRVALGAAVRVRQRRVVHHAREAKVRYLNFLSSEKQRKD